MDTIAPNPYPRETNMWWLACPAKVWPFDYPSVAEQLSLKLVPLPDVYQDTDGTIVYSSEDVKSQVLSAAVQTGSSVLVVVVCLVLALHQHFT